MSKNSSKKCGHNFTKLEQTRTQQVNSLFSFFYIFLQCTFNPFFQTSQEEKRLSKQQRPATSSQMKRSPSPSYAALHNGRCRSTTTSRNTTPLKNAVSSGDSSLVYDRVSQLLDTSVASATSDKKTAFSKISMDLLFANTH
jgi:hypothetical protein